MKKFFKRFFWFISYAGLMMRGIVILTITFRPGGGMDPRLILPDKAVQLICQLDVWIRYGLFVTFVTGAVVVLHSEEITG
ncbi:MAG: hypothetical protein Athens071412_555 [Parcubacteria group bacterium Athens0714_12]|nr:MAG: hypothetical protein Athens071412_555 [Parcubacteria group bacterium Athens0714_12]